MPKSIQPDSDIPDWLSVLQEQESVVTKQHMQQVGEVVWWWNKLHRNFAFLFEEIVGAQSQNTLLGNVLWSSVANDRTQRDMLKAALNWGYLNGKRRTNQILWAVDSANKLAVYRNDMVHTAMGFTLHPDGPRTRAAYVATPPNRILRLYEIDTLQLLRTLSADFSGLAGYVLRVWRRETPTLRPTLRTPQLVKKSSLPNLSRKK